MPTYDIVPFGKYKGQPIETLLTDVEYLQWCQTNGVLDRYPWLQVMVVSGQPREDQPTPAHNRLQERFADWEYCRDVLKALGVDARHVPPGFASWKERAAKNTQTIFAGFRSRARMQATENGSNTSEHARMLRRPD